MAVPFISFEGAFHGHAPWALSRSRIGRRRDWAFRRSSWPHIVFPVEETSSPKETLRREVSGSLKQLWDLLVSGRLPRAEKSKDSYRREIDILDEFLAQPGRDPNTLNSFVEAQRANLELDADCPALQSA